MLLGVDDCLCKEAISAYHLTRSIQHAIHRKKNEDEFAHLSTHDQLTGLANRYLLYEHLERTINISARNANVFANLFDIRSQNIFNETVAVAVNKAWVVKVVGIADEHVKPFLIEFNWCIEE